MLAARIVTERIQRRTMLQQATLKLGSGDIRTQTYMLSNRTHAPCVFHLERKIPHFSIWCRIFANHTNSLLMDVNRGQARSNPARPDVEEMATVNANGIIPGVGGRVLRCAIRLGPQILSATAQPYRLTRHGSPASPTLNTPDLQDERMQRGLM
jgi:hypothetical protein